jgi:hypothetical protein
LAPAEVTTTLQPSGLVDDVTLGAGDLQSIPTFSARIGRRGPLRIRAKCPSGGQRCVGTLRFKFGRVAFSVAAGDVRTLRLKVKRAVRRRLRSKPSVRLSGRVGQVPVVVRVRRS